MRPFTSKFRCILDLRRFIAITACLFAAGTSHAIDPGEMAPDFTLQGPLGEVRLAGFRGHVVYLDFWASWCAPCLRSLPWMAKLQSRFETSGLRVVAVNLDKQRAEAIRVLATRDAPENIAFDPEWAVPMAYGVRAMPTSVLVGADGVVLAVHEGFQPGDQEKLEAQVAEALARQGGSKGGRR